MDKDPNVIEAETTSPPPRPRTWDDKVYQWWMPKWRRIRGPFWVLFFLTLFLTVWLFDRIFVNIYPGHAGVIWRRFTGGTDVTRVYEDGLWLVNPFNRMYIYETRMQQRETTFTALTSNGLIISIRASVRFRPELKHLPLLHEGVGPEYVERVVLPQVQSVIRKIIGSYEPDDIYGTQGNILQNVALTAMGELRARYIELDDLLIREIVLPPKVATAIENKLEQEQLALQFTYILAREEQEAERKRIEAKGIQDFQRIVSEHLTENYLRFRGISATVELARSPNAKVVIFGNNPSGLPLILNTGDSPAAMPASGSPASLAPTLAPEKLPVPGAGQPEPGQRSPQTNPPPPPAPAKAPGTGTSASVPSAVPPLMSDIIAVPAEVADPGPATGR